MGIFDALKKKKAKKPVKPLESPPPPDQDSPMQQPGPMPQQGPQGMPPQAPVQGAPQVPAGMQQQPGQNFAPGAMPQPQAAPLPNQPPMFTQGAAPMPEQAPQQDHIQATPMPNFALPPQAQGPVPGHREEPEHVAFSGDSMPQYPGQGAMPAGQDMPMPAPPQEDFVPPQQAGPMPQAGPQGMPQPQAPGGAQQQRTPQFTFYQAATPQEVAQQQPGAHPLDAPITAHGADKQAPKEHSDEHTVAHVPFDVSQELLTLPEVHKREHPELYSDNHDLDAELAQIARKKHIAHKPKQFITMSQLFSIGEQLVNMGDDLSLAKDTAFRLTDLNEQEIESMAKWHALQESIELRIAEMDKLLFKTKV